MVFRGNTVYLGKILLSLGEDTVVFWAHTVEFWANKVVRANAVVFGENTVVIEINYLFNFPISKDTV